MKREKVLRETEKLVDVNKKNELDIIGVDYVKIRAERVKQEKTASNNDEAVENNTFFELEKSKHSQN